MIIKKLVVGSLFSMLLGSGAANADWGDVYYCQMTNFSEVTSDGVLERYKLKTFQFKLDQARNEMVFGIDGFFADTLIGLTEKKSFPSQEVWVANNEFQMVTFDAGKFLLARHSFFLLFYPTIYGIHKLYTIFL